MKQKFGMFVLYYLRFFARLQIAKIKLVQKLRGKHLTIVGITGSAGKSSTIAACQAAIQDSLLVKTTAGSNSESGIPLNILDIKISGFTPINWLFYCLMAPIKILLNWKIPDVYLIEMGIDSPHSPKNMAFLLSIVIPDIGIFLNVNLAHSANFDQAGLSPSQIIAKIGAEKARLINSLPPSGYALLNIHDHTVLKTTLTTLAKKIPLKPIHINFTNYAPPADFDLSISAAINLAQILQIDPKIAQSSLQKNLVLPPSRSSVFKGINDSTIIDSSYNSSPLATTQMLDVLKNFPHPRIAILGDMRELGEESNLTHQQIYQHALKCADKIFAVGLLTQKYFGAKAQKFTTWFEANKYIKMHPELITNSTILIKGSQNEIYLEELVKVLLLDKNDTGLLCRQTPYWQNVKKSFRQLLT